MKQCPFLLRLCQEVLLRATRWFFFFSCFLCRKRKVNAESVSLPHKWNKRPHTAGNPGRMIVATRLDKSRRIGKQSYSLCCGLPFSRFRWCLFPFGDSFFTDFPLKFFLPNLWGTERNVYWGLSGKNIKPIDIQNVMQNMSGWLCKTKRLRGFNLQLHLGAF